MIFVQRHNLNLIVAEIKLRNILHNHWPVVFRSARAVEMRVKSVLDERPGRSDIEFQSVAQSYILDQEKDICGAFDKAFLLISWFGSLCII